MDDNINKTICRLYLNKANKYLAFLLPAPEKGKASKEDKVQINSVNDIFNYSDRIKERIKELENTKK